MSHRLQLAPFGLILISAAPVRAASLPRPAPAPAPTFAIRALQSEEFHKQHAVAQAALIQRLFKLATWCNGKELFLERDKVYREILVLEPDNIEARKALRYARTSDGSWKEPPARVITNRSEKALPELRGKLVEAVAPFRDRLLELLEQEKADAALRAKVHAEILARDPDDERVHAIRGEVRLENSWVMAETAAGKQRRGEIKTAIQGHLAEPSKAEVLEPTEEEKKLVEAWQHAVKVPAVRVLGTTDAAEVEKIAQACAVSGQVIKDILGVDAKHPAGATIYVMRPAEKDPFIDRLPGIDDENRTRMKTMMGAGIHNSYNVYVADEDPAKRIDCAVRHTLAHAMRETLKLGTAHGWVWEGFGLYFTRELVGTRYTWFSLATPGAEGDALQGNLLTPSSNWMAESLKLLEDPAPPNLAELLAKDLFSMKIEDMLVSYALAAYLIEGHPKETPGLLARLGAGEGAAEAFQASLGLSLADVQERLTRWLKERK